MHEARREVSSRPSDDPEATSLGKCLRTLGLSSYGHERFAQCGHRLAEWHPVDVWCEFNCQSLSEANDFRVTSLGAWCPQKSLSCFISTLPSPHHLHHHRRIHSLSHNGFFYIIINPIGSHVTSESTGRVWRAIVSALAWRHLATKQRTDMKRKRFWHAPDFLSGHMHNAYLLHLCPPSSPNNILLRELNSPCCCHVLAWWPRV